MSAPQAPPAGWYDDPTGSNRQRWFDGIRWTDHYQSVPNAPVVPPQIIIQVPVDNSRKARDKAIYTRQQKGHSLVLFLLIDFITLYTRTIYYTLSPNHYWHV